MATREGERLCRSLFILLACCLLGEVCGQLHRDKNKWHAPEDLFQNNFIRSGSKHSLPCPRLGDALPASLKVVVGTPKRVSSTWIYNAVRLMLKYSGIPVEGDVWEYKTPQAWDELSFKLIKVHNFSPRAQLDADVIITAHRSPKDAIESFIGLGIREGFYSLDNLSNVTTYENLNNIAWGYFGNYHDYKLVCDFDLEYESMVSDPESTIRRLAFVLGLGEDCFPSSQYKHLIEDINRLRTNPKSNGRAGEDSVSLFHRQHVAPGGWDWRGRLPDSYSSTIRTVLKDWGDRMAYDSLTRSECTGKRFTLQELADLGVPLDD